MRRVRGRRDTAHEIRVQRAHVVGAQPRERRVRHRRIEPAAVRAHAAPQCVVELLQRVVADPVGRVRRDVRRIDRPERRVHRLAARVRRVVGRVVAGRAVAGVREVTAARERRGVGVRGGGLDGRAAGCGIGESRAVRRLPRRRSVAAAPGCASRGSWLARAAIDAGDAAASAADARIRMYRQPVSASVGTEADDAGSVASSVRAVSSCGLQPASALHTASAASAASAPSATPARRPGAPGRANRSGSRSRFRIGISAMGCKAHESRDDPREHEADHEAERGEHPAAREKARTVVARRAGCIGIVPVPARASRSRRQWPMRTRTRRSAQATRPRVPSAARLARRRADSTRSTRASRRRASARTTAPAHRRGRPRSRATGPRVSYAVHPGLLSQYGDTYSAVKMNSHTMSTKCQ